VNGLVVSAFAVPIVTGLVVVLRLCPPGRTWSARALAGATAVLVGLGLHTLWSFAWLAGGGSGQSRWSFAAFDLALPVLAFVAARLVSRRVAPPAPLPGFGNRWHWTGLALMLAFTLGAAIVTTTVAVVLPHGTWDSWAVWNFKARWLALGGSEWSAFLTHDIFLNNHPDYPLFLPLSIARVWMLVGDTPVSVPQAFGVGGATLTYAVMFAAVWKLRGPLSATVACGALMALPRIFHVAAMQYADVALACAYLTSAAYIAVGLQTNSVRAFGVAGLAAGVAVWTKNEGTLFVGSVIACLAVSALIARPSFRTLGGRTLVLISGLAPFLAAVWGVKATTPVNLLVSFQTAATLRDHVLDSTRYAEIFIYTGRILGALVDPLLLTLVALYLLMCGRARRLQPAGTVLLLVGLNLAGYCLAFVITPYPLGWHLSTAADRMLVQIWPTLVFGVALVSGPNPFGSGDEPPVTAAAT
jgi:hypothetical protein